MINPEQFIAIAKKNILAYRELLSYTDDIYGIDKNSVQISGKLFKILFSNYEWNIKQCFDDVIVSINLENNIKIEAIL